jgi:exoribonuclease-2
MCKDFTSVISRTLATANNVKQQRHRYWLLKWLEERTGSCLEAMVIDSGPKRVNLVLTDILMDIDLPASRSPAPEPGTILKVRPVKVSPLDNSVRFDW